MDKRIISFVTLCQDDVFCCLFWMVTVGIVTRLELGWLERRNCCLPPHTKLDSQTLDCTMFGLLKRHWADVAHPESKLQKLG